IYSLDLMAMVGPNGWVDREPLEYLRHDVLWFDRPAESWLDFEEEPFAQGQPTWSVYFHLSDRAWIIAVHALFLVVISLFTIGFCTRLTAVLTWVAIMSYIQ